MGCLIMPYAGTTINGCDCPGVAPASGVLIDGDMPTIDTTQRETWASGLFVVNVTGRNSIWIGFEFGIQFFLRNVELTYLDCAIWGTGINAVNVHISPLYPAFLSLGNIGTFSLVDSLQSCISLRTISIPVQPTQSSSIYFLEFVFISGSSIHTLTWLHLAEVTFSDTAPTSTSTTTAAAATTTTTTTATSFPANTESESTTMLSATLTEITTVTEENHSQDVVLVTSGSTTQMLSVSSITTGTRDNVSTMATLATETSGISSSLSANKPAQEKSSAAIASKTRSIRSSSSEPAATVTPVDMATESRDGNNTQRESEPIPIDTIVFVLVGVIILLIVFLLGCCVILSSLFCYKRYKQRMPDTQENQYCDISVNFPCHELKRKSLPPRPRLNFGLPDPPCEDGALYSDIQNKSESDKIEDPYTSSGVYDDIGDNHYSLIPELYLKAVQTDQAGTFQSKKSSQKLPITMVMLKDEHEREESVRAEDEYTDMRGSRESLQVSNWSRQSSPHLRPGPKLVTLSEPLSHKMDDNPTYDSSWSLLNDLDGQEGDVYMDPDATFNPKGLHSTTNGAVFNDSRLKPSLFKSGASQLPRKENKNGSYCDDARKIEEEIIYSPIYIPYESDVPLEQRENLSVSNSNVRGVKVLGTGFFGKVVLADTVGLSLKDMAISDDDDKSASIRVAVKKLKPNASETTKEAFEKEYKFMSRLSHPNIVRLLGVCTTAPSQFIMMEYMERGDLNSYLKKFERIIEEGVPNEKEILVGTLVYMCTQIASAMNYLVTRNFIHRDLAARNCLVGADYLIKLADFGMSRSLYESHYYVIKGQAVLPVRWMATECFYGKFSAKTDVWSFGVTMWEILMLAKERPYAEMEDLELVNDAIENENRTLLQQPAHCPDEVYKLMMKCWASDPQDRATFSHLHSALSQL